MKYTLLELVQAISDSIDGDEVSSISDTVESLQIVSIIKTVLDDIVSRGDLVALKTLFNLSASGDNTKPVLMIKPDTIDTIDWIKYNKVLEGDTDPVWSDVQYLNPENFLRFVNQYTPSEANVDTFIYTSSGFSNVIPYRNDTGPCYYTSFDDTYIIFDAYDNTVDTTLQQSKTTCYGKKRLDWQEIDTYVPPLQPAQFPLLLNEAKAAAWNELRQTPNAKIEQNARRNWRHSQKARRNIPSGLVAGRAHRFDNLPNFGRK